MFIGSLLITAVASSCIFICIEPSPAISKTHLSGYAICAPIAAGNPYPIVPRPPLEIKVRGLVYL